MKSAVHTTTVRRRVSRRLALGAASLLAVGSAVGLGAGFGAVGASAATVAHHGPTAARSALVLTHETSDPSPDRAGSARLEARTDPVSHRELSTSERGTSSSPDRLSTSVQSLQDR